MKRFINLTFVSFLLLCFGSFKTSDPDVSKAAKYKVIGYVAGWRDWTGYPIEVEKLTHINYAFATLEQDGSLKSPGNFDEGNFQYLNSLRSRNRDLKIIISIGGWGADYFSNAALTEASRKRFARSAVSFMKRFRLDGVDIDWEYPGQAGGGNVFRAEDKGNFTLMLKELRTQLDAQSQKDGRKGDQKYLLTIASGGDKEYLKHTDLGEAHKYLDFINIMTYDLYNGMDKETGHHSGLYQSAKGNQSRNASADAVQGHIDAGVPAGKIVLGLPFYGRGWTGVKDQDNGLFQPSSGKHLDLSFDTLSASYINKNGFVRYWDEDAKSPYLWNPATATFITYADEESLTYKLEYVRSKGLGGVMFWEYSLDLQQKKLLNKIDQNLNKGQK